MKQKCFIIAVFFVILVMSFQASAEQEINGVRISRIYVDPNDIVALTDTSNGCGSNFFHLARNNANFKEFHAYMFLAFKNQTLINLTIFDGCNGDRVAISHGSMEAQ